VAVVALTALVVLFSPWKGTQCGNSEPRVATYEQRPGGYPTTEALWRRIPVSVKEEQNTKGTVCPSCPPGNITDDVEYKRTFIAEAINNEDAATALHLTAVEPPEDTHAMSRGVGFTTGAMYEADFITGAIGLSAAEDFEATTRFILDFGGSSGRVVRVIKAAFPSNKYALCDPNPKSIAWAQEHLPGIHAFVSPAAPPLPLDAKSLDLIYAVSIWSHYAERLALLWLKEMHRLLKPKGLLYITTHGKHLHACAFRCLLHVS
jgi:SAM-dependent methyltransferase